MHLSAIGHPIVGDSLYGGVHRRVPGDIRAVTQLDRPFLHAAKLVFKHPPTAAGWSSRASCPPICKSVLDELIERSHPEDLESRRRTAPDRNGGVVMAIVYKGRVFSVEVERRRFPNGQEHEVAIVRHPPSVVLAADARTTGDVI